eukprot:NODE_260_length_11481_cov_1.187928.p7 type:complete len:179 gc:universal NODE_260_length_11481_cov_1.187928:10254-10790(+)
MIANCKIKMVFRIHFFLQLVKNKVVIQQPLQQVLVREMVLQQVLVLEMALLLKIPSNPFKRWKKMVKLTCIFNLFMSNLLLIHFSKRCPILKLKRISVIPKMQLIKLQLIMILLMQSMLNQIQQLPNQHPQHNQIHPSIQQPLQPNQQIFSHLHQLHQLIMQHLHPHPIHTPSKTSNK